MNQPPQSPQGKPAKRRRKRPRPPAAAVPTQPPSRRGGRLKIRHLIFILLVFSGIIPLLISSGWMIKESRNVLKTKEKELLQHRAEAIAKTLSDDLAHRKSQLRQLGVGFLAHGGGGTLVERFATGWAGDYFQTFADDHPEMEALFVVNERLEGITVVNRAPQVEIVRESITGAMRAALAERDGAYRFVSLDETRTGVVIALAVPADGEVLLLESLVPLQIGTEPAAGGDEEGDDGSEGLFLVDGDGKLLWAPGRSSQVVQALLTSSLVSDFAQFPISLNSEYDDLQVGGKAQPTLARIVPVEETGWGVVAHKPIEFVFTDVRRLVVQAIVTLVLLVILSMVFALGLARGLGRPIQRLVEASHEIAAGNFDRRVSTRGLGLEIADLADDFNRMSEYVENYIEQLRKAAEANRELFISTIRAFATTIDAKDPYTRGHSERVAAYSRSIARYLGLPKDQQERVWISAVLHDVGKIGVEDRILKKVGVLTPEEFEQMKLHPVIGAEIVEPIAALREMIPGIRWHHEGWNGTGYPDKLKGEQIPLMARIIGVADTFDAITTTRPYQNAYSTDYALQTIKKLTGKKFDAKIVTAFLLAFEAGHIKVDEEEGESVSAKVKVPEAVAG